MSIDAARALAAASLLGIAAGALSAPPSAEAGEDRRIQPGERVDDVELPTLAGGKERLLGKDVAASVLVFFRPEQDRSADALQDMARCEKEFEKKPVRWVGVVSDSWPAASVAALARFTGVRMPILVDVGDALYGKLGVRLHPVVVMVGRGGKLAYFEPFRAVNYCDRIRVRLRVMLGEATEADVARADDPPPSPLPHSTPGVAARHLHLASKLHDLAQDAAALAEVQKSLSLAPTAAAWSLRGQILAQQRRCPDAVLAFQEALKLDPAHAAAREGMRTCGK